MDKILIVEDEGVLAEVLAQKLRSTYDVTVVHDGAEGLAAIRSTQPALVILDIFLPTMNGIEVLTQKKADPTIASIPVIVLSNSLEPIEGKTLESLGATKFLIKANLSPDEVENQVRLVFASEVERKTMAEQGGAIHMEGKKVLVLEDDDFLSKIICKRLEDAGAEVSLASTGEQAIESVKNKKPDICLLDILLPGITGFDVLEHIRNDEGLKDTPVIMISNFNQDSDKERAQKLGAGYLVKAMVNPDDIVMKAAQTLQGK